ncbi:class C sortase [Candidatus Enterococcus ferrettii]|uniref:Sortase A n=1 Tax=Candidatus Enterococcus ferrettii TaxID=2815324 RepID=A0ABV0EUK2_9ENTE|nr:class C sortase [Enterococcus sp. 665A]MBO1341643.1 class C sortase [Enterococcus sp. 665A]
MKRAILIIGLLISGVGIIAYPFLGNYFNQKNATQVAESYQEEVDQLTPEQIAEVFQQAKIYNENLLGQPAHDPFIPGSGIVMPANYYQVLKVKGIMAQVEIPSIDVNLPVYHGTKDDVLRKAVGHLEGSALPIGGEGTHSVLTSHTGLTHAKLFTDLTELKESDLFYVHVLDQTLAYEVDKISVIEPEHTELLKSVKGEDYVTLLTCTPYGVNSHRLLVRGKRVPYDPSRKVKKKKLTTENHLLLKTALITSGIMLLLVLLNYWRNKHKYR